VTNQNQTVTVPAYAEQLQGMTLKDWYVKEMLVRPPDLTGGYYSVQYIVTKDGKDAFLKAFDLKRILEHDPGHTPLTGLLEMTTAFQFERNTLHTAMGMDRVIDVLDDGDVYIEPGNPFSVVPYIIMEKADADVNQHLKDVNNVTVARRLHLLHHVAIGMMQLHGGEIVHQDLKPSNIVVWEKGIAKVADLGKCSIFGTANANDYNPFAGDLHYAPPETLYGHLDPDWKRRRYPIDLYLFGSIIVFLFTQASMSSLMLYQFLAEEHRPKLFWQGKWGGTFLEAMPYLENAFAQSVAEFEQRLPPPSNPRRDYRPALVKMVREMCHPDPEQRGTVIRPGERSHTLNRAVTILNRLEYNA
jgi:serine/threonine protein kinase